jgi:glycosyltransferase involved in cell wall biosynthesis
MKNKFLIVDNDYSRISGSTRFLHKELNKIFKYDLIWDEKWSKSKNYNKKIFENYDNILFIHSFLRLDEILKLKNKNIIWIPMFDSLFNLNQLNFFFWKSIKLLNIKIISFSSAITKKCIDQKIDVFDIKYFLKTYKKINYNLKKLNILFWDRGELKIEDWINYFNKQDVEKITVIQRPDPGKNSSFISYQLKKEYNIVLKKIGYIEKSKYKKYLISHNVYICPRFREGIGISFLEALSHGMFILGLNAPTMNEYLNNGKIGICIKLSNNENKKLDLNQIILTQKDRINLNTAKYNIYNKKISEIGSFLQKKITQKTKFKNKIYILVYQKIYDFLFLIKRIMIKINVI